MTKSNMDLSELLAKHDQGDFLRSIAEAVLQLIMEADVDGLIGAGRHERGGDRATWRNGYRDHSLDTRLGTLNPRVPKLRQGSYFPGFPEGIQGPDLMMAMKAQSERFGAELVIDDVTEVDLTGPVKTVTDATGATHQAKAVILAMGSGYRRLGVPGEDRLSGHGLSWCATCDGFFFRGKEIAVVGGGDSAMEEATFLSRFARSVTVIHRRGELRASKIMAARAENDPKISFAWWSEVATLHGDTSLTGITHRDTRTGAERELAVNGLFIAIGHDPRSELLHRQV